MKDIEDEMGLESSVNKTPYDSKIDFTEQSQKNSKVNKDNNNKKINEELEEREKDDEIDDINEKKNVNKENENEINNNKNENLNENEEDKQKKMEEYMKSHQPKIDWGQNNNNLNSNKNENENENEVINNDEVIEEQINSNIENSRSKIENKSKLGNSKNAEVDDEYGDYGGFDNINSVVMNNQDNLGSLLVKKNDIQKKITNESNSNTKNLASSESKYEGEFGQSNLDQIKELEDKRVSPKNGSQGRADHHLVQCQ